MHIKSFDEFLVSSITEDFNGSFGREFKINISRARKPSQEVVMFYEPVPKRFSLPKYMKSFTTPQASDILKSSVANYWRACFFFFDGGFDSFVWTGDILHSDAIKALDNSSTAVYPKRRYLRVYNDMNLLSVGEDLPKEWCLPVAVIDNRLQTNLPTPTRQIMASSIDLTDLFELSDIQATRLLKSAEIQI